MNPFNLFGRRKPDPLRVAERVINDFGAFIERHPTLPTKIEDTSALPHPKAAILDAILVALRQGCPPPMEEILSVGARSLAQYQPGVGKKPVEMLPSPGGSIAAGDLNALREEARRMSSLARDPRWEDFHALAKADGERISKLLQAGKAEARRN